ncbi:MAG: DedA family protein [Actinomycetes bacterium]
MADEHTDEHVEDPIDEHVDAPIDEVEPHEEWHTTIGDVFCIGGIVLSVVRAWVTLLFVANLIGTRPVLLELLRGSSSSMITGGAFARDGRASLALAIIFGIIGLGFLDVFYWWAGRRYGNRVLAFYTKRNPRYRRWVARSEKFLARWGGLALVAQYYQPIPSVLIHIGTGASGMSLWMWFLCNTIGCALWVGLMVGLGYSIGHPAVHIATAISHYGLIATIVIVVIAMVVAGVQAQRQYREPAA